MPYYKDNYLQRIGYLHNFRTVIARLQFIISFLILCSGVSGQVQTNQELAELQTRELLDSIYNKLPDDFTNIGFDVKLIKNEERSFLINNFVKYFSEEGKSVSLDTSDIKISFENFKFETIYLEKSLNLVGFDRNLQRNIRLSTSGHIKNNMTGSLINPFYFERTFEDSINTDMLEMVERSPYFFLKGKIAGTISWTKYVEPAVILVSVSSLIYLFFTMRY